MGSCFCVVSSSLLLLLLSHLVFVWFHLRYYYYPILPEGEWDFEIVGFCLAYYYPILPEGEWDFEIVGFCLPYYYYTRSWNLVLY